MTTIVGISGSLRRESFNTALLQAIAAALPSGAVLRIESIRGIPLYDGDVEREAGIPAEVARLKDAIAAADALLIATPEYNNGMPGVLKNAIDWLSRPPADIARVFGGKPVAVVGATIGAFGTALAQSAWLPVLRLFNVRPYFGARLMIARAADVFDAGGKVKDETVAQQIRSFADGFVRFVREVCAAPA